jgi:hypothetical protein
MLRYQQIERLVQAVVAILAAAALCGCAGYRLGPTNGMTAGAKSIEVKSFVNRTMEPRLIEPLNQALRRNLQQDGTYRLCTSDGADVVVTGVITTYNRDALSFLPNDVVAVRDYNLFITAEVKAVDRVSGKVLVNKKVVGRTLIRVGSDLTSAERQAAPLLAEDLARRITMLLVDGTW